MLKVKASFSELQGFATWDLVPEYKQSAENFTTYIMQRLDNFKTLAELESYINAVEFKYISETLSLELIKRFPLFYRTAPKTLETSLLAFRLNPRNFVYIPEDFVTDEMCLEAVSYNGTMIRFVPARCMSKELVLRAITQNGQAILYIPPKYLIQRHWFLAAKTAGLYIYDKITVQPKSRNYKLFYSRFCYECAKHNFEVFEYVQEFLSANQLLKLKRVHKDLLIISDCNASERQLVRIVKKNPNMALLLDQDRLTKKLCCKINSEFLVDNDSLSVRIILAYQNGLDLDNVYAQEEYILERTYA